MDLKVELAREADFQELMQLYRAAVGEEGCTWNEYYPSEEDIRGDLDRNALFCAKNEAGEIIAAFAIDDDREVDGLACWSPKIAPVGEVSRLVVRRDCQNRGLAGQMLSFAMQELRRRGYQGIHFLVSPKNERALRAYGKLSFQKVGEAVLYNQDWYCFEQKFER